MSRQSILLVILAVVIAVGVYWVFSNTTSSGSLSSASSTVMQASSTTSTLNDSDHVIAAAPISGTVPLKVAFTVGTNKLSAYKKVYINFGDRSIGTDACNPANGCLSNTIYHTYIETGTYTVYLIDADEGRYIDKLTITVGGVDAPLPTLSWKPGDAVGRFTLTKLSLEQNPPDRSYPYYVGSASFTGTTTVNGEYTSGAGSCINGQWEFAVRGDDLNKIPIFPNIDPIYPNQPTEVIFCLTTKSEKAFIGTEGNATITIANYQLGAFPKGEEVQNSAELISIQADQPSAH